MPKPIKRREETFVPISYIKPKTPNQAEYIRLINNNTITLVSGLPGCGKTAIAVGYGVRAFLDHKFSQLLVTRPVLESGEKLGALPGDISEKTAPYLVPIMDEIHKYMSHSDLYGHLNNPKGGIKVVPMGFCRGRNFHNSFIILDEAQNCTFEQLKMFLTRIGTESKMIITGDLDQSDLPKFKRGGFATCIQRLADLPGVGHIALQKCDIVRNGLIADILERLSFKEPD